MNGTRQPLAKGATRAQAARSQFWRRGEPLVWLTGAALSLTLLITASLIIVVLANGLGYFWPRRLTQLTLVDESAGAGSAVMGEIAGSEPDPAGGRKLQVKTGNRDLYGQDFRWIDAAAINKQAWPADAVALERQEYGNFYGFLKSLALEGLQAPGDEAQGGAASRDMWSRLQAARKVIEGQVANADAIHAQMSALSASEEALRLRQVGANRAGQDARAAELASEIARLKSEYERLNGELTHASERLRGFTATFTDAAGREKVIPLMNIVRAYRPNAMSLPAKLGFYASKIWELLAAQPRESNTEGGLFPAIFGTVAMVLLMSLFAIPMGVVAAVYLREYAREGPMVRLVRIAVNNLAGVPSIVYGVFGLGFFVYGIGAGIDRVFFSEKLPSPTFGTGGLLWASLTLALLTVPVVIVATEEALAAIPRGMREGSLALGSTKFQTLTRILLPMATPGIMTGLILAMARAAGEVAPLMIVGVVKLAPALPLDGQFPFVHLDRKFMHLGFHIYDVGFQSPNVEAAKPMVFVTTLLLLLIVIVMSALAIYLRNKMKERYTTGIF